MTEKYTIDLHRHNFAAWAAARAAQRSFTSVDNLKKALEECGVREFLSSPSSRDISYDEYKKLHSQWCKSIVLHLDLAGIENATFGRAAKLIAVYVKAMVVMCDSDCNLSKVAYPPIDGLILKNISKDRALPDDLRKLCSKIKWTHLDEEYYNELIQKLQKYILKNNEPMWLLENYWTVIQN